MAQPGNELVTLSYRGGSATGARGFIEYLFAPQQRAWVRNSGNGRRPYKTRQRSAAAAGEPMKVVIEGGEMYTLRVTGTHNRFIDELISRAIVPVLAVYSERGTVYAPQLTSIGSPGGPTI